MYFGYSVTREGSGNVKFSIFGAPIGGRVPLVSSAQNKRGISVFMGRLYYRRDIISRCKPIEGAESLSPAALALVSYERLGLDGLKNMEGDFSCSIWDRDQDRILALRDSLGGQPLFWFKRNDLWALSTGLRPLLELLPSRRLNPEYLVDFLMLPGTCAEVPNDHCVFEGITRLAPGTILDIKLKTGKYTTIRHWDWLARKINPPSQKLEDLGEQYKIVLSQAVDERLQGLVASHMSGGMDSTSVALLSRNSIAAGKGESPLHTISLVYDELSDLSHETPYLEELLKARDFVPHVIPADNYLDFDGFNNPPFHDEPYGGLWRLSLDASTVMAADECGASTMLTGLGADDMLDVRPFYLADLLRDGQWLTAWKEASKWAQNDNCSAWTMLQLYGFTPLLAGLNWPKGNSNRRRLRDESDYSISPWIRPEFVKKYKLAQRLAENAKRSFRGPQSTTMTFALSSIQTHVGNPIGWAVAAPRQIAIAHPFLDNRVLSLGLGMMSCLTPQPQRMKPVLAQAMHEILSEPILNRRRKGNFNEVYFRGMNRNLPLLDRLIENKMVAELGFIDQKVLLRCVHEAALGGVAPGKLGHLNMTLCLLVWLAKQAEWYSKPMPNAQVVYHS